MTSLRPTPRLLVLLVLATLAAAASFAASTRDDLRAAVEAGNATGKDFSAVDAAGLDLTRPNLSAANLSGADLRGIAINGGTLDGANLSRSNLRGAVLERVSLVDADLSGCDLSGAVLNLVNLDGANLADCTFRGTSFNNVLLSSGGGTHLPALRAALQQATGQTLSRAWVAGLSGDAFAFCYNTQDPSFWPGTPFTVNPLLAGPTNMGLTAKLRNDYFAEQLLLDEKAASKDVQMLAIRMQDDPGLLEGRPLWAVLAGREVVDTQRQYFALSVPPFGPQTYRVQDLLDLWTGPWENLEPVGSLQVVRKALLTITPSSKPAVLPEQAQRAMRQAAQIILDKRTYGPLIPGEAGLTRLAADLRTAAQNNDLERAQRLALWGILPRQCLIGSRTEACDFLTEAAVALDGDGKQAAQAALAAYQPALAGLREQWPELGAKGEVMTDETRGRYLKAADLIAAMAVADRAAAAAFAKMQ